MGTNESAETKGKHRHGKGISLMMSKNRGIWHGVRERMIKHNKGESCDKRMWYLSWQISGDKNDWFNSELNTGRISQWCNQWRDMEGWWHDQLVIMEPDLFCYTTRCHVGLVVQSLFHPTTKHPPNNCSYLSSIMLMLNSWTFQSANGLNTITRLTPRRSGGDYPSGQQVAMYQIFLQFDWRLIRHSLDPWHGLHRPPFNPGVQDLGDGRLSVGASPLQSWRIGEAQGTGANWSSSKVLVEDHQDGGNQSWGCRQGNGRLYQVHETFFSNRNETVEDVERGRGSSESIFVLLSWLVL